MYKHKLYTVPAKTQFVIDGHSFRYSAVTFVRLSKRKGSYKTLQVFTTKGEEHKWTVTGYADNQIYWVLNLIRDRIEQAQKGSAPESLQSMRATPQKTTS